MASKTARRSILGAGLASLAALLVGNRAEAKPLPVVGLARIKCCGTCGHLVNQAKIKYVGPSQLKVPLFGWCDLVSQAKQEPPSPSTGSFLHISGSNAEVNRHFLMVCREWHKAKKGS